MSINSERRNGHIFSLVCGMISFVMGSHLILKFATAGETVNVLSAIVITVGGAALMVRSGLRITRLYGR